MKRFYKFLMPLVAIVALALPVNVVAQSTCANGQITVSNADTSTTTTSYFPAYAYYNYSASEQIVPASELEGLGEIHSMQFKPSTTTAGNYYNNCSVYLGNTILENLSAGWVQDTTMHLVFTGSLNYTTADWQTITFDSAFNYTGGNLIVLVIRNHGDYLSGCGFHAYNAGSGMGRYAYTDNSAFSLGSIPGSASAGTSANVGWYKFTGCYEPIACAKVSGLHASNIGPWTCTLTWSDPINSGASYTVVTLPDSTVLASGITDTTVDLTGLTSDSSYIFCVYADCGGGDQSRGVNISIHTLVSCPNPTGFVVDSATASELFVHWTPGYQETEWALSVGDSLITGITDTFYSITDLNANTLYNLHLRAICGVDDTSVSISTSARTDCEGGSCNVVFYLTDGFGDGWNGNAINVVQAGTLMGSATIASGSTATVPVQVCSGIPITLTYTSGSYPDEIGGTVVDGGGSIIFTVQNMDSYADGATLTTAANPCPDCIAPVDLVIDTVLPTEITLHWNAGTATGWLLSYGDTLIDDITTNSYTITGLDQYTQYSISVYAICDNGDTSAASLPITARTTVSCPWPVNITATATGGDTVMVSWAGGAGATSTDYYLVYGPSGFNPTTVAESNWIQVNDTTYEITGITAGLYDVYVRCDCGGDDGISAWGGPASVGLGYINIDQVDTLRTCGAIICDNGGPMGSYGSSRNDQVVVFPLDSLHGITISGNSYTESSFDYIRIYEGVGTSGTQLWNDYGVSSLQNFGPFDVEGPITITFHSDGSVQYDGFQVSVMCYSLGGCQRPTNLVCTSTTPDSVAINWNGSGASGWDVFVGPAGALPNADSAIAVTDSNYVFTNLLAGVSYDVYVRSDCGAEQSDWRGPLTVTPGTYVIGTSGSATISMCGGVIYDDGGATGQYSNNADFVLTVYPSHPDSMLTFQGTAYTESSIDYLRIYEGTSPSGTILWQTSTSSQLDNIPYTIVTSGPITLKWHTDGSVVYDGFALQIGCMAAPECSPVEALTVHPTPTSALVTWQPGFYGNYTGVNIEYKADTSETWISLPAVTGTYTVITGLDPVTDYNVRVTTDCDGFPGGVATADFTTANYGCLVADSTGSRTVTVGTGSSTTSYFPTYSCYNYALSEQVFTSTELGGGGNLVSMTMTPTSVVSPNRSVEIYLGHVSGNTLSNFVYPADLTLVYTGTTNLVANQPYTFTLDNAFMYNGSDNLLVLFRDMTGNYSCSNSWAATSSTSGVSRYVYQDSGPYALGYTGGYSSSDRANTTFNFLSCSQYASCAAPAAAVVDVTTTTATVVWAPGSGEASWNVYYRLAGDANWSAPTAVTVNNHTFTGLLSGRRYEFMVENSCSEGDFATTVNATTLCAQISSLPFTENFNSWGTGVTPNCWSNQAGYSPTSYGIISSSYNHSGTTGGSIYMYSSSGTYVTYLALPELDTTVYQPSQLQLVFNLFYNSTSYSAPQVEVGVMASQDNSGSFVPVDTVTHSGALNTWEVFEVPLTAYTGNGTYVAIRTNYPGAYSYFYMDDLTLEVIPTCPRPDSLTASNATTTSIDLAWHERGGATSWIIEYGPRGFQLGTGTTVVATSNPFTLTGLPSSYQGEYYVKSICGAGDTGEFSRTPCAFGTTQIPATLPYDYDFENAAEWGNWQTSSNHETYNWYRGTSVADSGSYSMYVAIGDTASYYSYSFNAVVNAAAYRDIDFGPIDSSYTISFSARAGGTTDNRYDALMVFLVDPSLPTIASTSGITSPWGNVNDLYRIATIYLDTTWQTYEASFDTIHGVQRVAFFWFNQNTGASYTNIPQPGAVDNIHIDYSACVRPVNVDVTPGSTTALVTWDGEAGANYQVIYRQYPGAHPNSYATASTNQITLTGLTSNMQYAVWVRKLCSASDTSLASDGFVFFTSMCDGAEMHTNYDSTATVYSSGSGYSPIGYSLYNYSYVQTIIDSATMAQFGGDITAFGFMPLDANTGCEEFDGMNVYMANVSESSLSSDFIHPDSNHVFVHVISNGNFNFTSADVNTWVYHSFDTAFTWDGHSNVLFAVNRLNGSYQSTNYFAAHNISGDKMRYIYQDGSQYDINTVTGGYTSNTVGDIMLVSCGGSCHAPVVNVTNVDYQGANVTAAGNGLAYELAYGTDIAALGDTMTNTTGVFNLTGLNPNTQYFVGVRQQCDSATWSSWTIANFTTDELPCFTPDSLEVVATSFSSATLHWISAGSATQWAIEINGAGVQRFDTVGTNPYTISNLYADQDYTASVRALCLTGVVESDWSDTIAFHTDACLPVAGVGVNDVTSSGATASWQPTNGALGYRVSYGYYDFYEVDANRVELNANTTSYTFTDLAPETHYEFYVQTKCGEGLYSVVTASDRVDFNTAAESQGIYDVESGTLTLFPNPASTSVTLSVSGIDGEVTVEIVDMNGRKVSELRTQNSELQIDLSQFAQGAYFVRVTGERQTAVRKLIVR